MYPIPPSLLFLSQSVGDEESPAYAVVPQQGMQHGSRGAGVGVGATTRGGAHFASALLSPGNAVPEEMSMHSPSAAESFSISAVSEIDYSESADEVGSSMSHGARGAGNRFGAQPKRW